MNNVQMTKSETKEANREEAAMSDSTSRLNIASWASVLTITQPRFPDVTALPAYVISYL